MIRKFLNFIRRFWSSIKIESRVQFSSILFRLRLTLDKDGRPLKKYRKFVKKYRIIILVVLIILFIIFRFSDWHGVLEECLNPPFYIKDKLEECSFMGKTAWQLLPVSSPFVLASGTILVTLYVRNRTEKQLRQDRDIANNRKDQSTLIDYFDKISYFSRILDKRSSNKE